MTVSDNSVCPRCRQPVELVDGRIRPHRDELTCEPCPTEGMRPEEARRWIQSVRDELERRAAASLSRRAAPVD